MNKRICNFILIITLFFLSGCAGHSEIHPIVATTGPVYEFTQAICSGTGLTVYQLITDEVSCVHDYTLRVDQMQAVESAQTVILSGAGLEEFMDDVLSNAGSVIDCSAGIQLLTCEDAHDHEHSHGHHHQADPHIWLSPENAMVMARNICSGLSDRYPHLASSFRANLDALLQKLTALQSYGAQALASLSCRELITFHDGFAYFAESFDLTILEAVEEESGSEASAKELKHLIGLVDNHRLPAIFTEVNGSTSAAQIICRETGIESFCLDMAMTGSDYFGSMYRNIHTVKEALE